MKPEKQIKLKTIYYPFLILLGILMGGAYLYKLIIYNWLELNWDPIWNVFIGGSLLAGIGSFLMQKRLKIIDIPYNGSGIHISYTVPFFLFFFPVGGVLVWLLIAPATPIKINTFDDISSSYHERAYQFDDYEILYDEMKYYYYHQTKESYRKYGPNEIYESLNLRAITPVVLNNNQDKRIYLCYKSSDTYDVDKYIETPHNNNWDAVLKEFYQFEKEELNDPINWEFDYITREHHIDLKKEFEVLLPVRDKNYADSKLFIPEYNSTQNNRILHIGILVLVVVHSIAIAFVLIWPRKLKK